MVVHRFLWSESYSVTPPSEITQGSQSGRSKASIARGHISVLYWQVLQRLAGLQDIAEAAW